MASKLDTKDKPYVENYPPLKAWLDEHGARCNWQVPLSKREETFIESWSMPNGYDFIVLIHAHRRGWNLYTAKQKGEVAATLADAELRLTRMEPAS